MIYFKLAVLFNIFFIFAKAENRVCDLSLNNTSNTGIPNYSILYPNGTYFKINNQLKECICKVFSCVNKCCEPGFVLNSNGTCVTSKSNFSLNLNLLRDKNKVNLTSSVFYIISGNPCKKQFRYVNNERSPKNDEKTFINNLPENKIDVNLKVGKYCIDNSVNDTKAKASQPPQISAIVCSEEEKEEEAQIVRTNAIGKSILRGCK